MCALDAGKGVSHVSSWRSPLLAGANVCPLNGEYSLFGSSESSLPRRGEGGVPGLFCFLTFKNLPVWMLIFLFFG